MKIVANNQVYRRRSDGLLGTSYEIGSTYNPDGPHLAPIGVVYVQWNDGTYGYFDETELSHDENCKNAKYDRVGVKVADVMVFFV